MDMRTAYVEEVRAQCPRVTLVYDLFHVVAKYGREVIDRVRVDETNRIARAAGPNDPATRARRRVIKGTRWLLLKNRASMAPSRIVESGTPIPKSGPPSVVTVSVMRSPSVGRFPVDDRSSAVLEQRSVGGRSHPRSLRLSRRASSRW